jgi:hypothetical protein
VPDRVEGFDSLGEPSPPECHDPNDRAAFAKGDIDRVDDVATPFGCPPRPIFVASAV